MPNVFGIWPENELEPKSRAMSLVALVIELGIVPTRLFCAKPKYSMFRSEWPIVDGRWPESWLPNRLRSHRVEILKIVGGMRPLKLFSPRTRYSKFCRLPISVGI